MQNFNGDKNPKSDKLNARLTCRHLLTRDHVSSFVRKLAKFMLQSSHFSRTALMTSASSQSVENSVSDGKKSSLLSTSAGAATLLIGLQVGSRALTFIVNQILLRYLSPARLGVSTQLEVYSITVLFFARESLRVAIQRQADTEDDDSKRDREQRVPEGHVDCRTAPGRSQAIVNLAYISAYLGVLFAVFLAWLYLRTLRSADPVILDTPYFQESLKLYGFAAFWELLAEPCFVIVQQKSRFKIRASAEGIATVLRCLVTCGSAIWAARTSRDIGVLPFALGQGMYSVALLSIYYWSVSGIASGAGFSLMPAPIYSRYTSSSCRCQSQANQSIATSPPISCRTFQGRY